jgi:hypothetical protein
MNQLSSASTMKLSMMVTITSCAPNLVLRIAGRIRPLRQRARGDHANRKREQEWSSGGKREADESGPEPTRSQLALSADVEQTRAQAERDGESGEGERRRLVENLSETVSVAPGAL